MLAVTLQPWVDDLCTPGEHPMNDQTSLYRDVYPAIVSIVGKEQTLMSYLLTIQECLH